MKKLIFALVALVFLAADCGSLVKDHEQLLTQKKGWELFAATSTPAFTNIDGVTNSNLFKSFWLNYECELDDILFFYENNSSVMNFGKEKCEGQTGKDQSLGNWRFVKNYKVLEFYLPYFFDAEDEERFALLEAEVIELDESTLQLRFPLKYDNGQEPTKAGKIRNDRGMRGAKTVVDYEFIFTYKVAK
ncbi:MAG: hypothetical protein LBI45_00185 [Bacteroidales bacterium]|jgi:hypothetical protein|nr:hypothetical protein [Bacteroidales bacterium]